jgi:hypothetical protein
MLLCAHFITSHIAEGMVTVNVMVMIATDAWGPVRVGRGAQLTADAEEESKWGETVFDSTVGLCNQWVRCVRGKNAWKNFSKPDFPMVNKHCHK